MIIVDDLPFLDAQAAAECLIAQHDFTDEMLFLDGALLERLIEGLPLARDHDQVFAAQVHLMADEYFGLKLRDIRLRYSGRCFIILVEQCRELRACE